MFFPRVGNMSPFRGGGGFMLETVARWVIHDMTLRSEHCLRRQVRWVFESPCAAMSPVGKVNRSLGLPQMRKRS